VPNAAQHVAVDTADRTDPGPTITMVLAMLRIRLAFGIESPVAKAVAIRGVPTVRRGA